MKLKKLIKKCGFIVYIASFIVLILFFLLGLILTLFSLQNLFASISSFGLMQVLFLAIGLYLVYKPVSHARYLIRNKKGFSKIIHSFIEENKTALIITTILSVVMLSIFYSNLYIKLDFFANAALYLPVFLLNNLIFIANIFLLRHNLTFLIPLIETILPISEILYLFFISRLIAKFQAGIKRNS